MHFTLLPFTATRTQTHALRPTHSAFTKQTSLDYYYPLEVYRQECHEHKREEVQLNFGPSLLSSVLWYKSVLCLARLLTKFILILARQQLEIRAVMMTLTRFSQHNSGQFDFYYHILPNLT